ncbi:hypothetical protein SAMN05443248_3935 [Bradyrhizobium erythrophlei]|uniref:Uncharacterized protein n=1 Tax=Bradyrhizobium erythrophlei TaxID=1437360 RepID=A0A1M5QRX7_9BRAD|nr:hypothetical protein SAMN05443248_3935 [Bradyrhizobium erythrophlei]
MRLTNAPTNALRAAANALADAYANAPTNAADAGRTRPPIPPMSFAPRARGHKHRPSRPHSDTAALSLRSRPNAHALQPQAHQSMPEPSPCGPSRDVAPSTNQPPHHTPLLAFPQSPCRHVRMGRAIGTCLVLTIEAKTFSPRPIERDFARALSAITTLSERKTRAREAEPGTIRSDDAVRQPIVQTQCRHVDDDPTKCHV